jgi:small conductance mechanosensitive channel
MYDQTDTTNVIWHWLQDPGVSILAILIFGWLGRHFGGAVIDRMIRHIVRSSYFNELSDDDVRKRQDTLIGLFTAIWKSVVIVVVSLLIFQRLFPQISLTPVLASAGIIGVALGFGAQSVIKDFLSGVFIILENQYRVGDIVDIEGAAGTVERISIRSTVLRDADGNVHYLPNGSVIHVINKTMGYSRVNFSLAVDPTTNIDELSELINTVGDKLAKDDKWKDRVIEPPHFLSIGTFSDIALEVKITGKTQPSAQWDVTGELRKRLLSAFKKNGIELATLPTGVPIAPVKK